MRSGSLLLACVVTAAAAGTLFPTAAVALDAGAPAALPACIQVSTEARYVPYGYSHIVILKSGCSKPATCSVSTDVNPQPTTVDVAPAATVEVLTYSGSPAQTFHARATCTLR